MNAVNIGSVFLFMSSPKIGLHYKLLVDNIGNVGNGHGLQSHASQTAYGILKRAWAMPSVRKYTLKTRF